MGAVGEVIGAGVVIVGGVEDGNLLSSSVQSGGEGGLWDEFVAEVPPEGNVPWVTGRA